MLRLILVLLALVCVSLGDIPFKNLAGDPSEFGSNLLPSPQQNAQTQSSAATVVQLAATSKKNVVSAQTSIYVDSDALFSFAFYSPHDEVLELKLEDPKGKNIKLSKIAKTGNFPIGDIFVDGTIYTIQHPEVGTYTLTITSSELKNKKYNEILSSTFADAFVLVYNQNTIEEFTFLNTYSLFTGSKIGVVTSAHNDSLSAEDVKAGKLPNPKSLQTILAAQMLVLFPDGSTVQEPMQDDGLNADLAANDGYYGAMITAVEPGDYIIQAVVQGTAPNGKSFIRTTEQLVSVIDQTAAMTQDLAIGTLDNVNKKMIVNLVLDASSAIAKYRAYAEVWGVDASGKSVAVCWIGGMSNAVAQSSGDVYLPLELDLNWVSRVGAQAPFVLRNVIVQDPATSIPFIQTAAVTLKTTFNFAESMVSLHDSLIHDMNTEITEEMRMGKRPLSIQQQSVNASSANVILSHGYCSEVNPFEAVKDQFTDALFFLNPKSSAKTDEFAQLIIAFAQNQPFSFIGHSQGGLVGLHIFNYYWTGIDNVSGGRVIQTIGSPYLGCGAAGAAAGLGKIFGVGCGTNSDLTKDGAPLWLAGIAQHTRSLLYYWTTTFKSGGFFSDNCNLAMNMVLSKPNDGVAELSFAQLEGGNSMGNKEKWCHSVGMKYTAQTQDPDRNKEMNAQAARTIRQA